MTASPGTKRHQRLLDLHNDPRNRLVPGLAVIHVEAHSTLCISVSREESEAVMFSFGIKKGALFVLIWMTASPVTKRHQRPFDPPQ